MNKYIVKPNCKRSINVCEQLSCVIIDCYRAVKNTLKIRVFNMSTLLFVVFINHLIGNVSLEMSFQPVSGLMAAEREERGTYWSLARLLCCYFLQLIMITSPSAAPSLALPTSSLLRAGTDVDICQTAEQTRLHSINAVYLRSLHSSAPVFCQLMKTKQETEKRQKTKRKRNKKN